MILLLLLLLLFCISFGSLIFRMQTISSNHHETLLDYNMATIWPSVSLSSTFLSVKPALINEH